jgi:hypothetical protein
MKLLRVPESNATKEVDAAVVWMVRWESLWPAGRSNYYEHTKIEAFLTAEAAEEFAASLRAAVSLLGDSGARRITVTRNDTP